MAVTPMYSLLFLLAYMIPNEFFIHKLAMLQYCMCNLFLKLGAYWPQTGMHLVEALLCIDSALDKLQM